MTRHNSPRTIRDDSDWQVIGRGPGAFRAAMIRRYVRRPEGREKGAEQGLFRVRRATRRFPEPLFGFDFPALTIADGTGRVKRRTIAVTGCRGMGPASLALESRAQR